MNEKDYTFHTVEEISTPKTGYVCLVDRWWSVNPEGLVMFYKGEHPQCNPNKALAQMLADRLHYGKIVHVPVSYVRNR